MSVWPSVNAADYSYERGYRWKLEGTPVHECYIVDGTLSCSLPYPPGTPTMVEPPFTGVPNTVVLTPNGSYDSVGEGGPPGATLLPPRSRITVGDVTCDSLPSGGIDCRNKVGGFRFDDGKLTKTGPTVANPNQTQSSTPTTESTSSSPASQAPGRDGDYTETDEPRTGPIDCGAAAGTEVIQIVRGTIGCLSARAVIAKYRALPTGMHGNANIQGFDGWSCSAPTARMAAELGYGIHCTHESRGIELTVPL